MDEFVFANHATERFLYPPPELIEHFGFGFHESLADSFWLRWIQDSDTCQTYLKPVEFFDTDKKAPLDTWVSPRHKNCDNSWAFKMLDAVTKLAPKFKMPYQAGAISLSVLTEDYEGASVIFDRGLAAYPNDWNIAYQAAYHEMFDKKNFARASELLVRAHSLGGPAWLPLLAARLVSKEGQIELGIRILENYRAGLKDEPRSERLISESKTSAGAPLKTL